jgi:hypothetical protein
MINMPPIEVNTGMTDSIGQTLPVIGIPSVAYIPPPIEAIPSIHAAIDTAFKELPAGSKGGLFMVVNETQANAAIVTTVGNGWKIETYIGKTWKGSTNYGANVMKVW